MKPSYVLKLADSSATLESVGGKGLSLARMAGADLPVPTGFHITTEAYQNYVAENGLQQKILAALQDVDIHIPATLEAASQAIRAAFAQGTIPGQIAEEICAAYEELGQPDISVAVRSSATAEDLPGASFAGQQDTYLNVSGTNAVLDAVKKCWSSLWTGRAIAYRIKNNIDQSTVALAVVVQQMVNAEVSGVLFTANPMNGRRDEMVINAAWGLGEAIVGGIVSPDTTIADKATGKVKQVNIAEKAVITVAAQNGTEEKPLTGTRRTAKVLTDAQVAELVTVARKIESFYGSPQDIEWCRQGGHFFIVQSRPITTLAAATLPEVDVTPPKEWKLPKGAYAALRNNIVELMADPLSPLFATLGLSAINNSLNRFMDESFAMGGIMPHDIIVVVNHYAYNNGSVSAKSMGRLFFGAGKIMKKMFTGAVERWIESGRPRYYQIVEEWKSKDWRNYSSIELVDGAEQLTEAAIDAYSALVSGVIPAAWITEAMFTKLYTAMMKRRGDPSAPVYLLGYESLPIRADQSLYSLAEWARQDASLAGTLAHASTAQLAAWLAGGPGPAEVAPAAWQEWLVRFQYHMRLYGHTIYDLDFMHPVPADDPEPVLNAFKLYLAGQGKNPYTRQRESAERREQAVQAMRKRLAGARLKWFNQYLARAQKYAPLREDGLAEIGLAYPLIRQMLRELGQRFAQQNVIPAAGDIYWLTEDEVRSAAKRLDAALPVESHTEKVQRRKAEHQVAQSFHPPLALPQMKVFGFDLMSLKGKRKHRAKGNVIQGVAASPGKATGTARILHGPEDFNQMRPGDVLVAPITTPAWTPLFAMAAAIVTDVGGPLSHGSIVAREYGIPAVLGTGVATRRIQSGQTVTVDGGAGTVMLHINQL
jgi:rifampicin phosphotransferase